MARHNPRDDVSCSVAFPSSAQLRLAVISHHLSQPHFNQTNSVLRILPTRAELGVVSWLSIHGSSRLHGPMTVHKCDNHTIKSPALDTSSRANRHRVHISCTLQETEPVQCGSSCPLSTPGAAVPIVGNLTPWCRKDERTLYSCTALESADSKSGCWMPVAPSVHISGSGRTAAREGSNDACHAPRRDGRTLFSSARQHKVEDVGLSSHEDERCASAPAPRSDGRTTYSRSVTGPGSCVAAVNTGADQMAVGQAGKHISSSSSPAPRGDGRTMYSRSISDSGSPEKALSYRGSHGLVLPGLVAAQRSEVCAKPHASSSPWGLIPGKAPARETPNSCPSSNDGLAIANIESSKVGTLGAREVITWRNSLVSTSRDITALFPAACSLEGSEEAAPSVAAVPPCQLQGNSLCLDADDRCSTCVMHRRGTCGCPQDSPCSMPAQGRDARCDADSKGNRECSQAFCTHAAAPACGGGGAIQLQAAPVPGPFVVTDCLPSAAPAPAPLTLIGISDAPLAKPCSGIPLPAGNSVGASRGLGDQSPAGKPVAPLQKLCPGPPPPAVAYESSAELLVALPLPPDAWPGDVKVEVLVGRRLHVTSGPRSVPFEWVLPSDASAPLATAEQVESVLRLCFPKLGSSSL